MSTRAVLVAALITGFLLGAAGTRADQSAGVPGVRPAPASGR